MQAILTVQESRQASSRHVLKDKKLLVAAKVVSDQSNQIRMTHRSQNLHPLSKIFLRHHNVSQPLHSHHQSVIETRLVRGSERSFTENLRGRLQQSAQRSCAVAGARDVQQDRVARGRTWS